jgi:hypothetical protein
METGEENLVAIRFENSNLQVGTRCECRGAMRGYLDESRKLRTSFGLG